MPRVYPPKKDANIKQTKRKPLLINAGLNAESAHLNQLHMGKFDICLSEDGEELQIWKDDKLIKTFK